VTKLKDKQTEHHRISNHSPPNQQCQLTEGSSTPKDNPGQPAPER